MHQVLLVPTSNTQELKGWRVLPEDQDIPLLLVKDEDGNDVLPAFSSEAALLRWKPAGSAYVGLEGHILIELLARSSWDRIVIDGADPEELVITKSDALRLRSTSA